MGVKFLVSVMLLGAMALPSSFAQAITIPDLEKTITPPLKDTYAPGDQVERANQGSRQRRGAGCAG